MKKLQSFCAALVFALSLSLSAFAGEISMPGDVQPTPTPTPTQMSMTCDTCCPDVTAGGNIQTSDVTAVDPVTEATLSLLQDMLSAF